MKPLIAAVLLCAFGSAAQAWEFTPGTPCILTHETDSLAIELTYDPGAPLYTISLTQTIAFVSAPLFTMQFGSQLPITISTDQHVLSNEGRTLTVTDRGFGNVLNGLQFNSAAIAALGPQSFNIPLLEAADPVAQFRACDVVPAA